MDVLMPQLGETVAEGKIIKWFKTVGDVVAPGEVLFEIETDKTSMEVPTMAGGTLTEIRVQEGQTVPVSAVVAVMDGAEGAAAPPIAAPAPAAASALAPAAAQTVRRELDPFNAVRTPEKNYGPATLPGGAKVTPLARRLAAEKGVDLTKLTGSGPHGRVVAADVAAARAAPAAGAALAAGATADQVKALYADVPYREVQLDGMRKTIARRLVESKQTVPHFYLTAEVSIEQLLALRQTIVGAGAKVSVNDFVVKAYALALQRVPAANAVWAEDRVLQFERSDVGVAVSVEGGLFTPVVRDADVKSLSAVAAEIRDLAGRARERKLKPSEYQGGSGAVSNLGMFGVREFAAIVNPPHATILAVGAGERRPVETETGGVRWESKMTVTLSVDHRVVDGALGAQLLAAFKAIVENPISALI
ncbi:MAG TPA: dihydrolipoamide acetyltransferase family protein [Caulobacteraceae bacterium]|jgi:pyruvate dehydrogenase E2 component (dihydrolipoamide acetyltransferase)|nr:dihydrolipoamide acetyltransferase family protein [Caulobacteraceae bacterium]